MTSMSSGPVVRVKPQSNVYTLLLIIAIVVLATAVGCVIWDLTENYALTFQQLFTGQGTPPM